MRERLFTALDRSCSGQAIWITAPAGAGKTSLVSSWIEARKLAHVWVQLDERDADPATFFHYLALGARALGSEAALLPALTPEYLPSLAVFARRFFASLAKCLPARGVIVLDNWQEVPAAAPIAGILDSAMGTLPRGVTLVLLSRVPPSKALRNWANDPDFAQLGWDDLRLSDDEALAVARAGDRPVDAALVAAIARQVRGWAAGLRLLLAADARGVSISAAPSGAQQSLLDYFAGEVFVRTSVQEQAWLVKCALAPGGLSAQAAAAACGDGAAEYLLTMHASRLFVDRRDTSAEDMNFEFHPLFREFLLTRTEILAPATIRSTRVALAQAMETESRFEDAATLWSVIGEWPHVARIAMTQAPTLMAQGRHRTLESWINALPAAIVDSNGWLLYWRGVARGFGDPDAGQRDAAAAYARFDAEGDNIGALLAAGEVLNQYFLASDDYGGNALWLDRVAERYERHVGELSPALLAQVFGSLYFLAHTGADHRIWNRLIGDLADIARQSRDPQVLARIAPLGLHLNILRGDFSAARWYLAHLDRIIASPLAPPFLRAMVCGSAAVVHWQEAQHDKARESTAEGIRIGIEYGIESATFVVQAQQAYTCLSAGDIASADSAVAALERTVRPDASVIVALVRSLRAAVLYFQGRHTDAVNAMQGALDLVTAAQALFPVATVSVQLAQLLMLDGQHDRAQTLLDETLSYAMQCKSDVLEFQARVAHAWSSFESGNEQTGLDQLRRALAIGARHNYMNCHPLWIPTVMARVFVVALENDIEPEYVGRVIRFRGVKPDSAIVKGWPWPIRVCTLGRFSVQLNADPAGAARKPQRRTLELLKAIIAMGGADVSRITLAAALWPDSEGDAGLRALEITLHRLRKLLGHDDAVLLDRGELSLNRDLIWVDAVAFDQVTMEIDRHSQRDGSQGLPGLIDKAFNLYRGHFLELDDDAPWMLAQRDRLRSRYRRMALVAAKHASANESLEFALELLSRAIEIDPLSEELYRRLIQLLTVANRHAEATEVYLRCERALQAGLDTRPSAETFALLHRPSIEKPPR